MAQMYAEDYHVGIVEALKKVYNSEVYQRLEQEQTKLWHDGPVALYHDLIKE
jgi:hypothetical protein